MAAECAVHRLINTCIIVTDRSLISLMLKFLVARSGVVICLLALCKTGTRVWLVCEAFVRLIAGKSMNDARSRRLFSIKCKISGGQEINCIPIRSATESKSGRNLNTLGLKIKYYRGKRRR